MIARIAGDRQTRRRARGYLAVESRESRSFIGITGHNDSVAMAEPLRSYDFEIVMMSLNAAQSANPIAQLKMEPVPAFEESALPVASVIIGCEQLAPVEQNVHAALNFTPIRESAKRKLQEKVAPSRSAWEKFLRTDKDAATA